MSRAIITMEGGLIQHIMADVKGVEVLVMDFDTEGGDDERIHRFEGNEVYVFGGPDDVDPERTQEIFDAWGEAIKS